MLSYGHIFRALSCAMGQCMNEALSETDLTFAQSHILRFLSRCQTPPCARDIEEHYQLSHPTVSGLLSRLEKKDFISVKADPQDRRRKLVYLRPKGLQCTKIMDTVIRQGDEKLVQGFSQEEKEQFRVLLTRALHNISPDFSISKEEFQK